MSGSSQAKGLLDRRRGAVARRGHRHGAGQHLVVPSRSRAAPSLMHGERKLYRFLAYISEACIGMRTGRLERAVDVHVVGRSRVRPAGSARTLPPDSAAMSTTIEPGFMRADHVAGDDHRRLLAGDGRGGDHHVGSRRRPWPSFSAWALLLVGELAGVAAGAVGRDAGIDELGAERLDLLPGLRHARRRPRPWRRGAWQVAIACRPATPAPMTSTWAGRMVPAAVGQHREELGASGRRRSAPHW